MAELLGVRPSSISRRKDLAFEQVGREKRIPPSEVLRLARHYRRRSEDEVASALLTVAMEQAPDFTDQIHAEITACLEESNRPPAASLDPEAFLAEARRTLPPALFREMAQAYLAATARPRMGALGATPDAES